MLQMKWTRTRTRTMTTCSNSKNECNTLKTVFVQTQSFLQKDSLRHNFRHSKTFFKKKIHSRGIPACCIYDRIVQLVRHFEYRQNHILRTLITQKNAFPIKLHVFSHAFPIFTPNGAKNFILYPPLSPLSPTLLSPADYPHSRCYGW